MEFSWPKVCDMGNHFLISILTPSNLVILMMRTWAVWGREKTITVILAVLLIVRLPPHAPEYSDADLMHP